MTLHTFHSEGVQIVILDNFGIFKIQKVCVCMQVTQPNLFCEFSLITSLYTPNIISVLWFTREIKNIANLQKCDNLCISLSVYYFRTMNHCKTLLLSPARERCWLLNETNLLTVCVLVQELGHAWWHIFFAKNSQNCNFGGHSSATRGLQISILEIWTYFSVGINCTKFH